MRITRREAVVAAVAAGLGSVATLASHAMADGKRHALVGKWHVRCPNKHVDVVTQGTRQHKCEECGKQCFVNGKVTVMCPKGHANELDLNGEDVVKSFKCRTCGAECQGW